MSMIITADTPYGKELWKWDHDVTEVHPSDAQVRGMRNPKPYPAMLYQATGKNPWKMDQRIVHDEVEQRLAEGQGFVAGGPARAAEAYDARMQDLAVAAAHRNYEDRNVSAGARAEIDAAEQASSRHLGEIPQKPKRGRKPKIAEVTHA